MKRTISECIDLIKQKKESAERTIIKLTNDLSPETLGFREKEEKFIARSVGYVEAYTDILALLESSHLVEQEKAIEILKEKFVINLEEYNWDPTVYYISFCGKTDDEANGGIDRIAHEEITCKEYNILMEVLK